MLPSPVKPGPLHPVEKQEEMGQRAGHPTEPCGHRWWNEGCLKFPRGVKTPEGLGGCGETRASAGSGSDHTCVPPSTGSVAFAVSVTPRDPPRMQMILLLCVRRSIAASRQVTARPSCPSVLPGAEALGACG